MPRKPEEFSTKRDYLVIADELEPTSKELESFYSSRLNRAVGSLNEAAISWGWDRPNTLLVPPELIRTGVDLAATTHTTGNTPKVNMETIEKAVKQIKKAQDAHNKLIETREDLMRHAAALIEDGFKESVLRSVKLESWPTWGGKENNLNFSASIRLPNGQRPTVSHSLTITPLGLPIEEGEVIGRNVKVSHETYRRMGEEMARKVFGYMDVWRDIAQGRYNRVKDIMNLADIEHRTAALRVFGIEKFIEEGGAIHLDVSASGNALYVLPRVFSQPAFFLKYKDPSTDRIYVSGIDPALFQDVNMKGQNLPKGQSSLELSLNPSSFILDSGATFTTVQSDGTHWSMINTGNETISVGAPGGAGGANGNWTWSMRLQNILTGFTDEQIKQAVTDGKFMGYADKAMSWKFGITLDEYLHGIKAQA